MKKLLLILTIIALCFTSYIIGYNTTTTTTNLELVKIAEGDLIYDWFDTMNDNLDLIDAAFDDPLEFADDGERVEDYVGGMLGGTETFISVDYQDATDDIDFVVPVKDEDNMASDSDTFLATQQSIKAYADTLHALQYLKTEIDSKSEIEAIWSLTIPDLTGTPVQYDYGRFTDADTIVGRSYAEVKTDLAYQLSDMSDVGVTTPTDKYVLVADGVDFESRAISSDDLSDVASIGMLDENEMVTADWNFMNVGVNSTHDEDSGFLQIKRKRDGDPTFDVANGDEFGAIYFSGFHTYTYFTGASIRVIVDGTPGTNDMPGRLEFLTTPDGSGTSVLRLAIDNAGNIKMGDGAWTNYVNVSAGGVLTFEGTASIDEPLSVFAATTSAELAGVISDETGSGLLVYGTAPTLSNVVTDIWLAQDSNTFFGVSVCGDGNLEHTTGSEGYQNTAFGEKALESITKGYRNVAIGPQTLRETTTGFNNTAIGFWALLNNVGGHTNFGLGYQALLSNISGNSNVAVGYKAGYSVLGSSNILIGFEAGYNEVGSNKLYIDNSRTATPLIYGEFDNDILRFNASVGIGASPTAKLHLPAGTATASTAPLKFTAGTLLTTPELGTMEYVDNGTTGYLYFTLNVGGEVTRVQIYPVP